MPDPKESLVERRMRYIERQRKLGHGVNVQFSGRQPEGSGSPNRHGLPSLPVDQHEVHNWPVLDLGDIPNVSLADWRLEIGGLVENPLTLTWDDFMRLPCVTTWSRLNNRWQGVQFKTISELAVPKENAHWILCTGYDRDGMSGESYTTNLPLARAIEDDVLLVHAWEGKPLPREHGGPCRMITPQLYAWKGAKWIRKIEFLEHNQKGFWEVRGYSDTAEPWFNDRYS